MILLLLLSLIQAKKFHTIQNNKMANQSGKIKQLQNEIYLVDQNFPYHKLVRPFRDFSKKGPVPIPKNWSVFHGNIELFLKSWNKHENISENLITGKIKMVMDKRKVLLIKDYLSVESPGIKLIDHSKEGLPIFQFKI